MVEQLEFSVTLNSEEPIDATKVRATLDDVLQLLRDIEKHITGLKRAQALWRFEDDVRLQVAAHVNGVDEETLSRVVDVARDGFARAAKSDGTISWPEEFGEAARASAEKILRQLKHLDSITVTATGHEPLIVQNASVSEQIQARSKRRRIYSSVDGVLELLSHASGSYRLGIREHRTRNYVRCSFSDEWLNTIKQHFDERVVVEGRVAYDENGTPLSIVNITDVYVRKTGVSLRELRGSIPELLGSASIEDYIEEIRG